MDLRASLDRIYRHRYLVAAILAVGALLVITIVMTTPAQYTAQATILMVAEPASQQNQGTTSVPTKPVLSGDLPALVLSTAVMSRAARDVGSSQTPQAFAGHVRAKVDGGSNIMPVTFTASSAASAIAGANAVAGELTAYYREIATSRFDSLAGDLRSRMSVVRAQLAADDEALAAAAPNYPYIDTKAGNGDGESAYARVVDLEKERDDAAAAAAGSSELARVSATILDRLGPLARSELGERDPRYRKLRDQYAQDFAEYQRVKARYAASYPGLPELEAIVDKERSSVAGARAVIDRAPLVESPSYAAALSDATKAAAMAAGDRRKLDSLNADIAGLESTVKQTGAGSHVAQIRRDRDAASDTYALLAARLAATIADRAEAASTGSVVVSDRAAYAKESRLSTRTGIALLLALLIVWLAYGTPMLLESLIRRFRVSANIEDLYGAPVVAVVS